MRCNIEALKAKEKLLGVTICLIGVTVIATYFSWLLGFQGFLLVGNIEVPVSIQLTISAILFYASIITWMGISINEYSPKLIILTLPFMVITAIWCMFTKNSFFITMIAPNIYILVLGLLRKDFKKTFKRNLVIFIMINLYQIPTAFIKLNFLPLNQNDLSMFQQWAYTIDYIVFLTILFLFGGVYNSYSRQSLVVPVQFWMGSKSRKTYDNCNESSEIAKEFSSLSKWERIFTMILFFGIQILQTIVILVICNFVSNITLKLLIIMASFLIHGQFLKERWHSNSIVACTLISSSMFFVSASLSPSFFTFQLIPIVIGMLLVYSLYKIKIMQDKKTFAKWKENIANLTKGKYANVANKKEVALAKGLSKRDLALLNYKYVVNDEFSQLLAKLSPWNDGDYVEINEINEENEENPP